MKKRIFFFKKIEEELSQNIYNSIGFKSSQKYYDNSEDILGDNYENKIKMSNETNDIKTDEVYFIKNNNKSTKPDSSKVYLKNSNILENPQKNKQSKLEKKQPIIFQKAIIDPQKEDKNKAYGDKKEKRKSKKIFAVIEKDGFKKKKEIIRRNENKKVGYTTKRKSRRALYIRDKIGRNTIQDIIPNWINYKEKDSNNILQKLDPSKIKDINKLKNVPIEEIFKSDITLKGNIDKQHNINIIKFYNNNNVNYLKKIKFKFTLNEIIKVIIDKNIREKILSEKMLELKEKEEKERKALINEFFEGLKGIEEYLNDIDGLNCYKKNKGGFFGFLNVD